MPPPSGISTAAGAKVISPTAAWLWWGWFILGPYAYPQIGANRTLSRAEAERSVGEKPGAHGPDAPAEL